MNSGRSVARRLVLRLAFCAAALAAAAPAGAACDAAAALPASFRLDYAAQATRGPFTLDGSTEIGFTVADGRYTLSSRTRSTLFNAEQTSAGELHGAVLVPQRFTEKSGRRLRQVDFDWTRGQVQFSANEDAPAATQPLLQDRLSLVVQAGQQLRAQQGRGPVVLPVAGVRSISSYRLELAGSETLALAAGRFDTLHLRRPLSDAHDGIDVWVAPALCWLPVRLRYNDEHGTVIQNQLRALRFDE